MKKTATMTFSNSYNYGAVLQMYALQHSILALGCDNKVIDYKDYQQMKDYNIIDFSSVKAFTKSILFFIPMYKRYSSFRKFIAKYIKKTRPLKKIELYSLEKEFDIFVTGSDQVWNYKWTQFDGSYFLDFVSDKKKISYAASIGLSQIDEQDRRMLCSWLDGYSSVSVREETAQMLLKDIYSQPITVDVDPVLLLGIDKWKNFILGNKQKGFVFAYLVDNVGLEYATKIAKDKNLTLIIVGYGYDFSILYPADHNGKYKINVSPEQWLSYIYYAEYVVTGSFHAIVFSLIFHKKFCVKFSNPFVSRIIDLLTRVGISADETWNDKEVFCFAQVNWDLVDVMLTKLRTQSIANLRKYLNSCCGGHCDKEN